MGPNDADGMANSVDPDQTAPLGYKATLFISKSRGPDKILQVISSFRQPIHDVIRNYDYNLHVHVFGNDILEFE